MNRTFTPFQIWLETQVANGHTLTKVGRDLKLHKSYVTRLRTGERSYPQKLPKLKHAAQVTGLSIEDLLVEATPPNVPEPSPDAPAAAPERAPVPVSVIFEVTAERVHVALRHGLKFGTERKSFCDTMPEGDIDQAWAVWCQRREAQNPAPEPSAAPAPPKPPALYDHLLKPSERPDYRPAPGIVTGGDEHSNFTISVRPREG